MQSRTYRQRTNNEVEDLQKADRQCSRERTERGQTMKSRTYRTRTNNEVEDLQIADKQGKVKR